LIIISKYHYFNNLFIEFHSTNLIRITSFTNEDSLTSDLIGILREWGACINKSFLFDNWFLFLCLAHHIEQFYKVCIMKLWKRKYWFINFVQDDQKAKVNIISKLMTDLIRHRHRLMCFSHTQVSFSNFLLFLLFSTYLLGRINWIKTDNCRFNWSRHTVEKTCLFESILFFILLDFYNLI